MDHSKYSKLYEKDERKGIYIYIYIYVWVCARATRPTPYGNNPKSLAARRDDIKSYKSIH